MLWALIQEPDVHGPSLSVQPVLGRGEGRSPWVQLGTLVGKMQTYTHVSDQMWEGT